VTRRLSDPLLDPEVTDPTLIRRAIARLRDEATVLGPDDPEAWAMLACAAAWELDLLQDDDAADEAEMPRAS
jgi:hypothetical protein